jgi:catechol 2,3-dioxygenase-like lactoylglutathione lyase family enzyme
MPDIDATKKSASPFASWKGQHAGIRVSNFDDAVSWYVEKLDFRLTSYKVHGSTTLGFLSPAVDDSFVLEVLANPEGAERPAYEGLGSSHNIKGWHHICFRSDDVTAALEELRRRGVSILSEPIDVQAFGFRFAFFADPWGNLFELMQDL